MHIRNPERFEVKLSRGQVREALRALELADKQIRQAIETEEKDRTFLQAARSTIAEAMDQCCFRTVGRLRPGPQYNDHFWLAPNLMGVALEETEYWTLPEKWVNEDIRIFGVYVYDANSKTYCCSTNPSYWLRQVDSLVITPPSFQNEAADFVEEHKNLQSGYYDKHQIDELDEQKILHIGVPKVAWASLGDEKSVLDYGADAVVENLEKLIFQLNTYLQVSE